MKATNKTKRHLTHEGHTAPLQYWADKIGISKEALMQRLIADWTVAEAVTTPKHNRAGKRIRRQLARVIVDDQIRTNPATASVASPPLEEMKPAQLATLRQFNSLLRQFNRDLHALMSRGVVVDLSKNANDRLSPVARDLS